MRAAQKNSFDLEGVRGNRGFVTWGRYDVRLIVLVHSRFVTAARHETHLSGEGSQMNGRAKHYGVDQALM